MRCIDCIHYEVCKEDVEVHQDYYDCLEECGVEKHCEYFKPKSRYVELPFCKIIVTGTAEKPYFNLLYYDKIDNDFRIGYSSYDIKNVFQWKEEYFGGI